MVVALFSLTVASTISGKCDTCILLPDYLTICSVAIMSMQLLYSVFILFYFIILSLVFIFFHKPSVVDVKPKGFGTL